MQVWILCWYTPEVRQRIEYLWGYVVIAFCLRLIGNAWWLVGIVKDERLFHESLLWWRLIDILCCHCFLLHKFLFFLLNVVSRLLRNGPFNFCINWKDGWIFGSKPLHELDEIRSVTATSILLCWCLWNCARSLKDVCSIALGLWSFAVEGTRPGLNWNNAENREPDFFSFFFFFFFEN